VSVDAAALTPSTRALVRTGLLAVPARVVLGGIVGLSIAVRAFAAIAHVTPSYFPDEYLYPALARGFATGDGPVVRGTVVHFPALLEPLLTAPFWLSNDPHLALRLTQGLHAIAMSLAAIPVYLLARRLNLSTTVALGSAFVAVACPDLLYASFTLSDPIAYPLVLAGVYAGVCALERPTRRAQFAFFAFSALATFTRVQYAALPLAFALAVLVLERGNVRRAVSRFRLSLALFGVPALGVLALGPGKLLGAYSGVTSVGFHPLGILHWAATDSMLLVYATGVVLLPGAIVALVTPRTRGERAFSVLTVAFTVALLLQAGFIADFDSQRMQERYFFPVLPLVAPLFGLALARGRNAIRASVLVSFAIVVLALRVPLSGYAAAHGKDDSPTLTAVLRLEQLTTPGNGSFIVALVTVALALAGAALLLRPRVGVVAALSLAVAAGGALSFGAHAFDARNTHFLRINDIPADARWIDHANLKHVALVEAPGSIAPHALEALWWNTSVDRELSLAGGTPTDHFGGREGIGIARDGRLLAPDGTTINQPLLVQTYGARLAFSNATLVARGIAFDLFKPYATPRVTMFANGYFFDGWLANRGSISLWPDASGRTAGTLRFALSMPKGTGTTVLELRAPGYARTIKVKPGTSTPVVVKVARNGPWRLRFSTPSGGFASDNRRVSVVSTPPSFLRASGTLVLCASPVVTQTT
jgi:hypothetical protein